MLSTISLILNLNPVPRGWPFTCTNASGWWQILLKHTKLITLLLRNRIFPAMSVNKGCWWLNGEESTCNAKDAGDMSSIPGWEDLQCSCLENPTDRGAWWATVYRVAKSWTWLKQPNTTRSKRGCHNHQRLQPSKVSWWSLRALRKERISALQQPPDLSHSLGEPWETQDMKQESSPRELSPVLKEWFQWAHTLAYIEKH